jgi:hypothetical protein
MQTEELPWNPDRVLRGLSRIGYSPVEAILDLVDNSVSADATRIGIALETRAEQSASGRGRPRVRLERIRIIDNGRGMTRAQLLNALSLGSDPSHYTSGTLSKFGLGMKSASGSLGQRLTVTTKASGNSALVGVLDHDLIAKTKKYVCKIGGAADDVLRQESGTEILIDNLHEDLPSHSEIRAELQKMLGLTYFYFLTGRAAGPRLEITLGGEPIAPFDPLFESELATDTLMDENTWDGCSVMWLCKPRSIQITDRVSAKFTVTHLPHPPSVKDAGLMTQKECRDKFDIGAKQYGVYIYRNGRLIGNAVDLGLIARDQDLYSYRARLEISDAADDALRIDVAKSQIQLSEIAQDQLTEVIRETARKSKAAWNRAKDIAEQRNHQDATASVNESLDKIARQDVAALNDEIESSPPDEREKLSQVVAEIAEQSAPQPSELEEVKEQRRRVVYESHLPDNQLWDRRYHPEHGSIAVVNGGHRFCTDVLRSDAAPAALQRAFDVLLFALSDAERQLLLEYRDDHDRVDQVLRDYRVNVGEVLSNILRKMDTDILRD